MEMERRAGRASQPQDESEDENELEEEEEEEVRAECSGRRPKLKEAAKDYKVYIRILPAAVNSFSGSLLLTLRCGRCYRSTCGRRPRWPGIWRSRVSRC